MAKQEPQISEEVWKRKDYLSARQTAANVTSYVFEGKEISANNFLIYAESIFKWLFQEQTLLPNVIKPVKVFQAKEITPPIELPTPTLEQQKILEVIATRLGSTVDTIKQPVLSWAKSVTGKENYPVKESSIDKFIEYYKNKK